MNWSRPTKNKDLNPRVLVNVRSNIIFSSPGFSMFVPYCITSHYPLTGITTKVNLFRMMSSYLKSLYALLEISCILPSPYPLSLILNVKISILLVTFPSVIFINPYPIYLKSTISVSGEVVGWSQRFTKLSPCQ